MRTPSPTARRKTSLVYTADSDNKTVSYDRYNVFGSPFDSFLVKPNDEECEDIQWEDGEAIAGSQNKTCSTDASVALILCGAQTEV